MKRLAQKLEGLRRHLFGFRKRVREEKNHRKTDTLSRIKQLDGLEDGRSLSQDEATEQRDYRGWSQLIATEDKVEIDYRQTSRQL